MRWKSRRQAEQDQEVKAHHIRMVAEEEAKHVQQALMARSDLLSLHP